MAKPGVCDEKGRLVDAYAKASAELAAAIAVLRQKEGVCSKSEYQTLTRSSEDAHPQKRSMFAFERHCQTINAGRRISC